MIPKTYMAIVESLLESRIGLAAESIGSETIMKAVQRHMIQYGLSDIHQYIERIRNSMKDWEELVELVVVPETWFFRNKASFAFLGHYVRFEWLPKRDKNLRILTCPCASGEEPYSIGMTLLDAGIPELFFHIDALDISNQSLQKAKVGMYGKESFRGRELSFRDRYFDPIGGNYQIAPYIRNKVQFRQANILDEQQMITIEPYDIIFCRNLLIYLSHTARQKAVNLIRNMLAKNGLLFVGHVERPFINNSELEWVREPGVFACRRSSAYARDRSKPSSDFKIQIETPKYRKVPVFPLETPSRKVQPAFISQISPYTHASEPKITTLSDSRHLQNEDRSLELALQTANRGDLQEALKLCEKCVSENAFHIQAHFLMGLIWHALDDEYRAEDFFNKAVYLDPNHDEALLHLACIMEHRGERARAEHLRQRAIRIQQREGRA